MNGTKPQEEEFKKIIASKLSGVPEELLLEEKPERDVESIIRGFAHSKTKEPFLEELRLVEDSILPNTFSRMILKPDAPLRMGMSRPTLAYNTMIMLINLEWYDKLKKMLLDLSKSNKDIQVMATVALIKLCENNIHREKVSSILKEWMKGGEDLTVAFQILKIGDNKELVKSVKRELIEMAKTEINETQREAISLLGMIANEDEEARRTIVSLLDDFDDSTRKHASMVLLSQRVCDESTLKHVIEVWMVEKIKVNTQLLEKLIVSSKENALKILENRIVQVSSVHDGKKFVDLLIKIEPDKKKRKAILETLLKKVVLKDLVEYIKKLL